MIWRDIHMLLALAGFTVCMALVNGMYSRADPGPESPEHAVSNPPGESVMARPEPGPGP